MEYRELGRTGVKVSALCLGTMTFGQHKTDETDAHGQLRITPLERGIHFIDTAEMYSVQPVPETYGATETIVGKWLEARQPRDKIILATKVAGPSRNLTWVRGGPLALDRANITRPLIEELVVSIA